MRSARFSLAEHPFAVDDAVSLALSEAFRHIVLGCRVAWAQQTHRRDPQGRLHVDLVWG